MNNNKKHIEILSVSECLQLNLSIPEYQRPCNLCLIQRNVNSRFSNMSPEAKKSTYKDMIKKGSLKLRINASQQWKDNICAQH